MKNILNILSFVCMFSCGACSDDDKALGGNTDGITVGNVTVPDVTYYSAKLKVEIEGSSTSILKKGFCYSTVPTPDLRDNLLEVQGESTALESELTGLEEQTTYYVRAFAAAYSGEPVYSEEASFTTQGSTAADKLADYVAPDYDDDYTNISSWTQRSRWNLANVHDPTVMKAGDGYYYMYQTDASYGNAHAAHGHFHARRSKDLVNWEYMGATMNAAPSWVLEKLNAYREQMGLDPVTQPQYGFWAPVVRNMGNGVYRMYYSIVIDNFIANGRPSVEANKDGSWGERAFIGLMETRDPASNVWEDKGMVVCSSSDKAMDDYWGNNGNYQNAYFYFNAIDPTYIVDTAGTHWLIYGSWHSGIAAVKVNPETGKVDALEGANPPAPWALSGQYTVNNYGKRIASRAPNNRWQGSEGPEIVKRGDYYYLFLAYGALDVEYNTRVVRSENPDGPYKDITGTEVTNGKEAYPVVTHPYKFDNSYGWVGISHCAIFDDGQDNWFYSSQGRLPKDIPGINSSNAVMMGHVRSIRWTMGEKNDAMNDWPVVMPERYGNVPQDLTISEEELIGDWEFMQLDGNHNGQQFTSLTLTLGANHKLTTSTGFWKNMSWTYDASQQVLSLNDGNIRIYLQREVDWEATPRIATVVGAGYYKDSSGNWKTNWMKRLK